MEKYGLLRQRLLAQAILTDDEIVEPEPATNAQLGLIHDADYVMRVETGTLSAAEVREIGLPWSPELVERARRSVGGTLAAAYQALERGVGFNLAGGTHHAHRGKGAGYCVFNDVAVAIAVLQNAGRIERAVVLDCDVHQGDGTASIFHDDETVFTLSLHGARNYPLRKARSRLDVGLDDGTTDPVYLERLAEALATALDRADADLAFYLAGADPYEGDRLGRLKLTRAGLLERDRMVFEACRRHEIPIVGTLAGGYAEKVEETVAIQAETIRLAARYAQGWPTISPG